jgi:ATP-dependent RNA helicase DDX6/DHH1
METQENKINPENNEIQNIPKEEIKSNSQEQNNNIKAFTKPTERLKTKDVTNVKGDHFEDYKLSPELLKGIYEKGYDTPSPVQEEVIPVALERKNIIARAKNGTGKTGSFVIPILQLIKTNMNNINSIQALILVPTRELALQISSTVKEIGKYLNVQCMVSTGGTNLKEDIHRLRNQTAPVHVVVGTPGRVLDLSYKGIMNLSKCSILVLDEADKLLSKDFQKTVENIIKNLPSLKQTMLFSATFPLDVRNFQQKYMSNSVLKNLMEELTLFGVTQYYTYIEEKLKLNCLHTLFQKLEINQAIIFCNTTKRVKLLAKKVFEMGMSCFFIHAQMDQQERNKVFHDFRNNACRCLVSTDLMTRGIDIPNVNVVFNFDFPKNSETYLHRIGRSGRFGHLGIAISFVTDDDVKNYYTIKKELDTDIEPMPQNIDRNKYAI